MDDKITEKLIALFHLDRGNREKNYGYFEGVLSIVVNIILFLIKFVFGTLLNSVSLLADAVHSLSDLVTSIIIIFGFRISTKPPDIKHPFGHGRAERIISIVIACMLIVVGFEFFLNGFQRFQQPIPIRSNFFVIALLILSIFLKEFLFRIAHNLGTRIESASLKADAWHHRTDAISTILVVIGFIAFRYGLFGLDGFFGMAVSFLIVYTGISIIKESASFLMGEAPSSAFEEKIRKIAVNCGGISDVHHIHVHDYGRKVEITIHIRLKGDTYLKDAHQKASEVEQAIKKEIHGSEVTIHVEPEYEEA